MSLVDEMHSGNPHLESFVLAGITMSDTGFEVIVEVSLKVVVEGCIIKN